MLLEGPIQSKPFLSSSMLGKAMPEGQHSGSAIHGQDSMARAKTHDKGSDHQTLSACITHAFSETCFFSVFIIPALLFSRMTGTCI